MFWKTRYIAEPTMTRRDNDSSSGRDRNRPKRSPLWYPEEVQPSRRQWWLFSWIALAIVLLFHYLDSAQRHPQAELTYSEFLTAVDQGHVDSVTLRGQSVEGSFNDAGLEARDLGAAEGFASTRPDVEGERLLERLEANGVRIDAEPIDPPWWQRILVGALPWILILGLLFWFWKRMQQRVMSGGGLFNMGKSSARWVSSEESQVRLSDVVAWRMRNARCSRWSSFSGCRHVSRRWGPRSPWHPDDGHARHGQDADGQGGSRRGRRAVLQHQRLGVHRDVRGRRGVARP